MRMSSITLLHKVLMATQGSRKPSWPWLWLLIIFLGGCPATPECAAAENLAVGASAKSVLRPADLLKEPDGLELRVAYFPSFNKLRLLVLRVPDAFTSWEARLLKPPAQEPLRQWSGPLPFPKAGVTLDTPVLDDGVYRLSMRLLARDGQQREMQRTFERRRFPWENNPAGRERVVIPPFTPLQTDTASAAVSCVLRRHELGQAGLWNQVTSQGRPLLAAPMRLEIETGGKTNSARGDQLKFLEQAADRVRGIADWTAGAVKGRTEFEFDYDGMARLVLHTAAADVQVDRMQLVIALKSDEAWLMHPVTDLLRFHYAGRIPDGHGRLWDYGGRLKEVRYTETGQPDPEGKVWDSRHVGRHQLPGPFVPYIWLGGPERGLCWFAENDRDWSLDPAKPCLEIRKAGTVTSLIVRMVTKPLKLNRPRRIVFGLMATPAKPMPEEPVNFRRWWTGAPGEGIRDVVGIGFMGSCYYWGAAGPCYAFYPAFKNFGIFDEFARLRDGGARNPKFTDDWLAQFSSPEFEPHLKTYRAHVDWSLNFFGGQAWKRPSPPGQTRWVIPYTNARAMNWGEELRTFLDEWSTVDVADPRWPGEERFVRLPEGTYRLAAYGKVHVPDDTTGVTYAADPVSSWQDMVLHHLRRMLETFADGIYFDDYFLVPNYNPLGPGYVDDDGVLRPGVNLFAFHELTKRVAVMQYRLGRRPLIFIHMTNTQLVPLLSFGTLLLDHEWRDQGDFREKDFHDRLYLEEDASLLLAQSSGFQSGCIGVIHNLLRGQAQNRSALGVALVHEMKFDVNSQRLVQKVAGQLWELGYGRPDCRVWRYWDAPQPVQLQGAPARTLCLARSGKAMIVLCSFGPAGEVTLRVNRSMLGLGENLEAVNAETSEPLAQPEPGLFRLFLPRHDFLIIKLAPRPAGT